jgi:chromosome segregation ATPase
LLISN